MLRTAALSALLVALCLQGVLAGTDAEGVKFLNENREREGVIELPSGLQYEIVQSGPKDNPHPNLTSECVCHYKGALLSGSVFDSSYARGSPATFQPNSLVKGWSEALLMMRAGDKWKLWLPSELAYGDRGAGGKIPGGAALAFELELLEVKRGPESFIGRAVDFVKKQPMMLVCGLCLLGMIFNNFFSGGGGASGKEKVAVDDAAAAPENVKVFFDIKIGEAEPKRVEMQLFNKHCPKTAENFRALCTGEKGKGKSGKELWFKDSIFHRIIPGFMCQGGDFTRMNGTGGESIFGSKFQDEWENGYIPHSKPGLLSMANSGPNTNGSQFFLTTSICQWLDGKHVVFGQVTSGHGVLKEMEAVGSSSGTTSKTAKIVDCGELKSKAT